VFLAACWSASTDAHAATPQSLLELRGAGQEPAEGSGPPAAEPPAKEDAPATEAPGGEGAESPPAGEAPKGDSGAPAATPPPEEAEGPAPEEVGARDTTSAEAGQALSGVEGEEEQGDVEVIGKKKKKKTLSHWKLGMVGVRAGWGLNLIVPYKDRFCGEFATEGDDEDGRKSICSQANPWFLEISAGYGAVKRMDVVVTYRLNLQSRDFSCKDEDDPTTCKGLYNTGLGMALGPGIRAWISKPHKLFKIGAAVDVLWTYEDFSGYRGRTACTGPDDDVGGPCPKPGGEEKGKEESEADVGNNDFGMRLGPIIQIDPHHNIGIVLQPWARMGLVRAFEIAFDITLGLQARFP
jgi:hypothetical protein